MSNLPDIRDIQKIVSVLGAQYGASTFSALMQEAKL